MESVRTRIVAQAMWGIHNAAVIHYPPGDVRPGPMPLERYKAHNPPLMLDCSEFATCCYYAAGAPDPNGLGYNGEGFTGTMLAHLPHIPFNEMRAGDLVVFGSGTGEHVVVVVHMSADPLVASHGQEAGPLLMRLSDERSVHPVEERYLRGVPERGRKHRKHRIKPRWTVHGDDNRFLGFAFHKVFWTPRHALKTKRQHKLLTFRHI